MTPWNDPDKSALLEALVTVASAPSCFNQTQREQIVQILHDRGFTDVVWNGLRQHLQKLRRKPGTPAAGTATSTGGASTTKKSTGRKRAKPSDDDDDTAETPSKKPARASKAGKVAVAAPVPTEEEEEEEEDDEKLVKDAPTSFCEGTDDDAV